MTDAPSLQPLTGRRARHAVTDSTRWHDAPLADAEGFLVVDERSRVVGRFDRLVPRAASTHPAAFSVRVGVFSRRRVLVPVEAVQVIDEGIRVIGLRIDRRELEYAPPRGRPMEPELELKSS